MRVRREWDEITITSLGQCATKNAMAGTASECYSIIVRNVRGEYASIEIIGKSIDRQVSQATVAGEESLSTVAGDAVPKVVVEGKGKSCVGRASAVICVPIIRQDLQTLCPALLTSVYEYKFKQTVGAQYFFHGITHNYYWISEILLQQLIRQVATGFQCLGLLCDTSVSSIDC